MPCYHPLTAWQLEGGEIVFAERGKVRRQVQLPCGRCIGCRIKRTRSWAIRCVHESQCHEFNSYVTLTYDSAHYKPGLDYRDVQLFMYRVRKRLGNGIRFFCAGEYGTINLRPHWHLLMFNCKFPRGEQVGERIYRSRVLEELWFDGLSSVGDVEYESAAYVAKYCCKKVTGAAAAEHYTRVDLRTGEYVQVAPEFARMSLRPGIGFKWFQKYWRDVYLARDGVCQHGGRVVPAPRYYDALLDSMDQFGVDRGYELLDYKKWQRYVHSAVFAADCTPERLFAREVVALAKQKLGKESL